MGKQVRKLLLVAPKGDTSSLSIIRDILSRVVRELEF